MGISKLYKILMVVFSVVAGLLFFLLRTVDWVADSGISTFEQVIFTLRAPSISTSPYVIWDFIWQNVPPAILLALVIVFVFKRSYRWGTIAKCAVFASTLLIILTLTVNNVNRVNAELHVETFLSKQQVYSDFLSENYVNPNDVQLTFPENPRNIIHIYLESLEVTFTGEENGGAFPENLMPELSQLARENTTFSQNDGTHLGGALVPVKTSWTSAALFAQTTGLPLPVPVGQDTVIRDALFMSYDDVDLFPNQVTTFGEILEEAGYQQMVMFGSDASFGGRRYYFEENGTYQVWDHPLAIELGYLPEGYHVWWGFEDAHLFRFAKKRITELAANDQPFNFTTLTVDTHFEDGHLGDCSKEQFETQYGNVIACSSRKVYDFVQWILAQPFADNTTIVITGDHLTMQSVTSPFWEEFPVAEDYQRRVFHTIINPAVEPKAGALYYRDFSTLDFFPTILASMGVEIEGNRLGLGTNLFSGEPTLVEKIGIEKMNEEILKRTTFFEDLLE